MLDNGLTELYGDTRVDRIETLLEAYRKLDTVTRSASLETRRTYLEMQTKISVRICGLFIEIEDDLDNTIPREAGCDTENL